MRVLNLYAGIGGNRKLWDNCEVVAIESNPQIAAIYSANFPEDDMRIEDAHKYLEGHVNDYDFIWSSPPCQSHSSFRQNICVRYRGTEPMYPDLKLYEEILFLRYNANCAWVVENVRPYYPPLIEPDAVLQRHLFWSNFDIPGQEFEKDIIRKSQIPDLQQKHGFDLSEYRIKNKRQVLRNCVSPELGLHVLNNVPRGAEIKIP